MQSPCGAAQFLLAAVISVMAGVACTSVSTVVPVGTTFQVQVQDQGRPVRGHSLILTGERGSQTVTTREDGSARFAQVPPETYQVGVRLDRTAWESVTVQVAATGPANASISLRWPLGTVIVVRSLQGALRWPSAQPDGRLLPLHVKLLDGRSGQLLQSTRTSGAAGAFHLATPPPGNYLLLVRPAGRVAGGLFRGASVVPVEVDERAPHPKMTLDFGETPCELTYVATHACPRQQLKVTGLSGLLHDASGASIPRASVRLFNPKGEVVEALTSDELGRFASMKRFDGDYELTVTAPGFTSLWQVVQSTHPADGVRPSALRIELGVAGACTHAAVQ